VLSMRMRDLGKVVLVKSSNKFILAAARAAGFTIVDVQRPPLSQHLQSDQPRAPEYHVILPMEQGNTPEQNRSAYIQLAREIALFGLQHPLTTSKPQLSSPSREPLIVKGIQVFCQTVQMSEETGAEKMQLLQFAEDQAAPLSWQEKSTALASIGEVYALLDQQKAIEIAAEVPRKDDRQRLYRALASAAFARGRRAILGISSRRGGKASAKSTVVH
jgi:hypothetical protein